MRFQIEYDESLSLVNKKYFLFVVNLYIIFFKKYYLGVQYRNQEMLTEYALTQKNYR
ncbi:hypothetical protein GCM10011573_19980 [Enterococcus wangshanyuanii]|uniref:Uncharacterized protein n=1 Tax=Enterococcus wangshanyuanii TaxID=2005703 RepID=A0ABQ1P423_9ENTE|nr:hypothetical protein GCM10011573_19980 [Enterococcus wangshanyuanii]